MEPEKYGENSSNYQTCNCKGSSHWHQPNWKLYSFRNILNNTAYIRAAIQIVSIAYFVISHVECIPALSYEKHTLTSYGRKTASLPSVVVIVNITKSFVREQDNERALNIYGEQYGGICEAVH